MDDKDWAFVWVKATFPIDDTPPGDPAEGSNPVLLPGTIRVALETVMLAVTKLVEGLGADLSLVSGDEVQRVGAAAEAAGAY